MATGRRVDALEPLVQQFRPAWVGVADSRAAATLAALPTGTRLVVGPTAAAHLAALPEVDLVVAGIVGFAGLESTLAALHAGKTVALANKEALVVGGELCLAAAHNSGATLIPVDSEHSAIFQVLGSHSRAEVARLILTGSGGPFRRRTLEQMTRATPEEALKHPNWSMGPKITVDSATLMNKALEVIEAHFLFGISADHLDVLIHPESLIHSMVEFVDGSILAQLGDHDMRGPIGYALSYPHRRSIAVKRLDLAAIGHLTFESPDRARFPCLALGHEALRLGGTAPAALSAANEVAVTAFLEHAIPFSAIASIVQETLAAHSPQAASSLEVLREVDRVARADATHRISLVA